MMDSQPCQESPSEVLRQYVEGRLTMRELDGCLSEAEYDDSLPESVKDLLAAVRLVIVEAGEGTATKEDVRSAAALALESLAPAPH